MKLKYKSPYLSIDEFDEVEIPSFVVLTGINGSGKSHLVQAIENGHVQIEGLANPIIVHFNYETFKLDNESAFTGHQLASEREQAWQFHQQNIKSQAQSWRSPLGDHYEQIRNECIKKKRPFWHLAYDALKQYRDQFRQFMNRNNMRQNAQAQGIFSLAKQIPYSIDEIGHDDFVQLYKPYQFKNDFLPNQLGKIFWDYYVKYRENQINAFENEKNKKNYPALTEEEFEATHGRKPWELVNEILSTFDTLAYRVNSPEGVHIFSSFKLSLQHTEKPDLEIDFGHLSSGERVLMALVASVYKSSSDQHFPDLLLLDEVDASLHPSMMRNMLDVIDKIFLRQRVNVILVSHSPTTIALAPETSLYVMNRTGPKRIVKKSKEDALRILTEGFATIEQGLRIFDQVSRSNVTVISEGHNESILRKALNLFEVDGVEILDGIQDISGKNQLKTLFQFFRKVPHDSKVIFVWDCDASIQLTPENKTFPYILPYNPDNQIARKGIENAFSEQLLINYIKTITTSNGQVIREFDETRKRDFTQHVCDNGTKADFSHFQGLVTEIERIKRLEKTS